MSEDAQKQVVRMLWTYTGVGVFVFVLSFLLIAAIPVVGAVFLVCSLAVLMYAVQNWVVYFWNKRK